MGGPSVGFGPGLAAGVGSAMMRAVTTRGFNRMKACRHGDMLFNVNDRHIGRSLDLYGEWAEAELELLGLFIKPGDTVVDVGANLGTHCLFFAQRVGSGGTVFAFEPQRIVFQLLCANLALNGLDNTHAFQAAVSRLPGTIVVPDIAYGAPGNYGGVGLTGGEEGARGAGGERVPVMTLDQLALERCRLLKIDVEGMELQVLEGGRALIEATRPIVYVENNDVSRSPALIGWLLDREYHLFWHVSRFFNPRNFLNNPDDVFANLADLNMIGVSADLASAFGRFPRVTGRDDNWQALQQRLR
jgi:FkbM family methyltransferase